MKPLAGKVAVVAGATRGAGRGIACGLGEAGATVYCTGRSVRGRPATGRRPETIEETAEWVTARGGVGLHARVDHTVEAEVAALFRRVEAEQGRLDVLVNDVWGGDELTEWGRPFWQLDLDQGFLLLRRAVHTHVITSRHGLPLMLAGGGPGLVVEITDGDNLRYRGNLFYDLAKVSVIRLAYAQARELAETPVTALALTPGFLRSEAMLEHFGVSEESWRAGAREDPHFAYSETPFFIGRSVAALAADPGVKSKAGRAWATWTLAREYGFSDVDGRRPDWGAHLQEVTTEALTAALGGEEAQEGGAEARDRARARLEKAVRRELGERGLQGLLPGLEEGFYRRLFDLASGADPAAVGRFVEAEL